VEFGLKITAQARRDFHSIWRYTSPDDPIAVSEFGERLLRRAESLTTFPHRHGSLIGQRNIRKVPFGSYIIYYKIYEDDRLVEILRFRHAARDQRRLRLKEDPIHSYPSSIAAIP
jgi:plasmid stabilization system protein ParE